jgi:transposase
MMVRRKYSDEFKEESVKLAQRSGVPMSQTAKELGVNREMLRRWVRDFGVRADGSRNMTPEEHSENVRLRRELKRVTEERDILKKAVGIFTKELP